MIPIISPVFLALCPRFSAPKKRKAKSRGSTLTGPSLATSSQKWKRNWES